jgi:hypothetical protein
MKTFIRFNKERENNGKEREGQTVGRTKAVWDTVGKKKVSSPFWIRT